MSNTFITKILFFPFKLFRELQNKLIAFFRKLLLRLQAISHRGTLILGSHIKIEHPVYFQGKGCLEIKENAQLGYKLGGSLSTPILLQARQPEAKITIGEETTLNNGAELIACSKISLGKKCLIGSQVSIYDSDFHGIGPNERNQPGKTLPVEIGDNVWIGSRAIILKGVIIGKDAVIGAACVVSKSIPEGCIVVGNPMRQLGSVYDRTNKSIF